MPESSVAVRTGLFTRTAQPVPLDGVAIDAEISTVCARVSVTQRYVNREPTAIEAVYVFPLDEGAAVCGFEAIIDGTLVVGEVHEREEAFRRYDDAMERGDGAFLLDEERPDVFQASVGNLPPGKEVLLKLTYVTELTVANGGLRFSIPTTVSPRYAPQEDHGGIGRPDAEVLNPPVAWRVPYGLTVSVRLTMPAPISRIESPSHPIAVTMDGREATVTLAERTAALDRDFILSADTAGLDIPQAWIERTADGTHALAVAFVPSFPANQVPTEVIFLVDRSGSMGGSSIDEVRNALQLCLRSMIPGCRFNIVGFGTTFQPLFRESRAYDDASLSEANAHVAALDADLGGTEILPALQFVLGQPVTELPRQVVVLTDGEVTNTDAVLELVTRHAAKARVFTFGIGAGASHHLVKGLARAGGGSAEFIYPGERLERKIVRQFARLLSPKLTDVRVDWGGLAVTQAPRAVPPVFAGERLLLYAFITEPRAATARLTALGPSGPIAFEVVLDPAHAVAGATVTTLAARARIRDLEEGGEWLADRGSRQRDRKAGHAGGAENIKQEIVALAITYGLMSRETSYVAIERRETPVHGDVQLRRVPIALTRDWGGVEHTMIAAATMAMGPGVATVRLKAAPAAYALDATMMHPSPAAEAAPGSSVTRVARAVRGAFNRGTPAPPVSGLHALVALQRADGTWDLTGKFAKAIGRNLADLETGLGAADGDRRRAWATALAIAWLETHARGTEDEWRLLAAKARAWLAPRSDQSPRGGAWLDAARGVVAEL